MKKSKRIPTEAVIQTSQDLDAIRAKLRCTNPDCPCHFPGGLVHCPSHRDKTPSFSITPIAEGLFCKCHAHRPDFLEFMECGPKRIEAGMQRVLNNPLSPEVLQNILAIQPSGEFYDWNLATKHLYRTYGGEHFYQVGRLGQGREQKIRFRSLIRDQGWDYAPPHIKPIPYNLQLFAWARHIAVCDNERTADRLNDDLMEQRLFGAKGIIATTTPDSLNLLPQVDISPFFGRTLFFLPGTHESSERYFQALRALLEKRASIRYVELPDRGTEGDYTEFRAAGNTLLQALELMKEAPKISQYSRPY